MLFFFLFSALCLFAFVKVDAKGQIVVNLPQFRLFFYQGEDLLREYPIGIGETLRPSVLGDTTIINRVFNPTYYPIRWWEKGLEPIPPGPDNPVGTRWLGLGFPSYGIHGTNNPASIGLALSAGCIRMHNEHVEELASLVRVGTPVSLRYETLLVERDKEQEEVFVKVLPDIYRLGTNTPGALFAKLEREGVFNAYPLAISYMVENPRGEWVSLPKQISFSGGYLVFYEKEYLIPLDLVLPLVTTGRELWGGYYASLAEARRRLGFGVERLGSRYIAGRPSVYVEYQHLGKAIKKQEWWVPLHPIFGPYSILAEEELVLFDSLYGVSFYEGPKGIYVPLWVLFWRLPGRDIQVR